MSIDMNTKNNDNEKGYWNNYYAVKDVPLLPSQFAVFVANEITPTVVVDIGCGNGRDSLFFARRRLPVIGIDASQSAVDSCIAKAMEEYLHDTSFVCSNISDPKLNDVIIEKIKGYERGILLYSRFFLHAVDESAQEKLFTLASKILSQYGGCLALEFRTPEDKERIKVTDKHYRRYIGMQEAIDSAKEHSLVATYQVQGLGMAKYKSDDAHVARILFSYSET